jgi:CBS-domain-containing membrane protein
VPPTATVRDALRTLEAHHLHSAPVLAADGRLVGIISEADLRRAIRLPVLEAIDPAGCLHHQLPNRVPETECSCPDDVDA